MQYDNSPDLKRTPRGTLRYELYIKEKLITDNDRKRRWAHSLKGRRYRAIRHMTKKYNMSHKDAVAIYEMDRTCEICGIEEIYKYRHHIDHDHVTGKVRGILCVRCNMMIGNNTVKILRKAIRYLQRTV